MTQANLAKYSTRDLDGMWATLPAGNANKADLAKEIERRIDAGEGGEKPSNKITKAFNNLLN